MQLSAEEERAAESLERSYATPEMAAQRARTVQALGLARGESVLDIGCGPGFLTRDLALAVGGEGSVVGLDANTAMLAAAKVRCGALPGVELEHLAVEALHRFEGCFDVVTCTQVLLYVADVPGALGQFHRLLRPGGRVAVIETDWSSLVLSSANHEVTKRVFETWDASVPSPNLPSTLRGRLRAAGFRAIRIDPIPVASTSSAPDGFVGGVLRWTLENALARNTLAKKEADDWRDGLMELDRQGAFFFCVNRFLFTAVKP